MPSTRPIPNREPRGGPSGLFAAWVQAEKLMQIAFVLPCAAFIGWLAGVWLDGRFHQTWIDIAGIVFGSVSGLVYVVRLVLATDRVVETGSSNSQETGKGSPPRRTGGGDTK